MNKSLVSHQGDSRVSFLSESFDGTVVALAGAAHAILVVDGVVQLLLALKFSKK